MHTKRIIPCLDVKDGKVVKGINFVGLKEVGDPVQLAKQYYEQGADELVFLDITATHEARDTMVDVVKQVAKEIFIPFTVGGGIRTLEDIQKMLHSGADKVSVNSAAIKDPNLIKEGARLFGSQCIVFCTVGRRGGKYRRMPQEPLCVACRICTTYKNHSAGTAQGFFGTGSV